MSERVSNEKELIQQQLSNRIDLLEKLIQEESSPEKLNSILEECRNLVGDNSEMYSIYKTHRLIQQSNFCSNLSLERQSTLLNLIYNNNFHLLSSSTQEEEPNTSNKKSNT